MPHSFLQLKHAMPLTANSYCIFFQTNHLAGKALLFEIFTANKYIHGRRRRMLEEED